MTLLTPVMPHELPTVGTAVLQYRMAYLYIFYIYDSLPSGAGTAGALSSPNGQGTLPPPPLNGLRVWRYPSATWPNHIYFAALSFLPYRTIVFTV